MSDGTVLNTGTGGDTIQTEQPGGVGVKYPVTKIYTGALDVNGGPVTSTNPLDVRISDATNTASVKAASTAAAATDKPLVVGLHPSSPLPTGTNTIGTVTLGADPDTVASGTITTTDAVVGAPAGAGAFLSGASTAGSSVAVLCPGGDTAWTLQLTGTFGGGTAYYEASLDSTTGVDGNWIAVNGRQTGVVNTVLGNGTTVVGFFRGNTSGIKYFRVRMVGGAVPTVAVLIRLSSGPGAIFMNASLPAGANTIGNLKVTDGTNTATVKAAATASVGADTALVVALHPSSPLPAGTNTIGTVILGADPDTVGAGTISTTDAVVAAPAGAGGLVSGVATAGSYLSVLCPGGDNAWNVQLLGTFGGGTVYFEQSLDSTTGIDGNWIAVNGRQSGIVNNTVSIGATTPGYYRGNTSGAKYFRIRMVGATTPSVPAVVRIAYGTGAVFLNASIPTGSNTIGVVIQAPVTKGTQGANGVTTQDLKDAGRVAINATADNVALTVATEAMVTMSVSRDGATVATATSNVITSGKRFRITSVSVAAEMAGTTPAASRITVRLRFAATGGALSTSPLQQIFKLPLLAAVAKTTVNLFADYPDGIEFLGDGSKAWGISVTCPEWVTTTVTPTVTVSLYGYEY